MKNKKWGLRLYFIAYLFVFLCLLVLATAIWFGILNQVLQVSSYSLLIWILVASIAAGTGATAILSRKLLTPLTILAGALRRVAAGDFSVRLGTAREAREIREAYENFNAMVQALQTTETLQTDFVSNVSHEFKTPIGAIEGYATLLQTPLLPAWEQREYVDKILFNTRRLSELVSSILLLSKVENQTIAPERSRYRLDEQIRKAVVALEPKWTRKAIEFDVELEELTVSANEALLLHVWINLLDNAIKFSPQGGCVWIRLWREAESLVGEISDNGPGIEKEMQKHIFNKFYQGDSSRRSEGNGLGLALVKNILDRCGGSVQVRSQPGQGACFQVRLPAGEPGPEERNLNKN